MPTLYRENLFSLRQFEKSHIHGYCIISRKKKQCKMFNDDEMDITPLGLPFLSRSNLHICESKVHA